MIEFESRRVSYGDASIVAAVLQTPALEIPVDAHEITRDGEIVELPFEVVKSIASAIRDCEAAVQTGNTVDCSAFGVMVAGGTYYPVDEVAYRRQLDRQVVLGEYLGEAEVFGPSQEPRLVHFGYFGRSLELVHTAVKLPTPDLFVQKLGHVLPIALADTASMAQFYGANCVATIDSFFATRYGDTVLHYESENPSPNPVKVYQGMPG